MPVLPQDKTENALNQIMISCLESPLLKARAYLFDRLAHGWSEEQLPESYPHLEKQDLQAVFGYLNECVPDGLMSEINCKTVQ